MYFTTIKNGKNFYDRKLIKFMYKLYLKINSTGYPEIGAVKNWIENNVIYNEAVKLETHTESCFENLDNCTGKN